MKINLFKKKKEPVLVNQQAQVNAMKELLLHYRMAETGIHRQIDCPLCKSINQSAIYVIPNEKCKQCVWYAETGDICLNPLEKARTEEFPVWKLRAGYSHKWNRRRIKELKKWITKYSEPES